MPNKNQEAFEQMQRLTKQAKKFYGSNYNPGSLYPPRDTKFFLNEDYIPFDFDTDYDDTLYKEYRRVRMLDNPFEDIKKEDNDITVTTGLDKENYATSVKNDKSKLPIYKEIANNIWEIGKQVGKVYTAPKAIADDYYYYKDLVINDKYKHAMINCRAAQRGYADKQLISFLSLLGEVKDVHLDKDNTKEASAEDDKANKFGRMVGWNNRQGNCHKMVSRVYPRIK